MRYSVFCKRKNLRLGWIVFEAETPEMAAEMARARGLEVELVRRAREGAGESEAGGTAAHVNRPGRDGRADRGVMTPVLTKVAGCLAAVVVATVAIVVVIALNMPDVRSAPPLRQLIRAPASTPVARCGEPITWYIEAIDPRFNVSRAEVRRAVERAARVWEAAWGNQVIFVHDQAGEMPIRLVFDERLHAMSEQRAEYERRLAQYNSAVESYNRRSSRHDLDIAAWNRRGGRGSEAEYRRLENERENLRREKERLYHEERAIEAMRPRGIVQAETHGHYSEAAMHDPISGAVVRIVDRSITILYFRNLDHLSFIIAHELGHALLGDKEHLDDEEALMHATPRFPEDGRIRLSDADRAALWAVCGDPQDRKR